MSGTIHGLSCAQCKSAITADGVTCAACSAPHHWPCFASAGHCASCQAAKPPMPFGVSPAPRGAPWLAAAGMAAIVAATSVVLLASRPVPPPVAVQPPKPPSIRDLKEKVKAAFASRKTPVRPELGADPRLAKYPGRLSGFLNTSVRADQPAVVDLTGTPVKIAFLEAEVRLNGTAAKPTELVLEGRAQGRWIALSRPVAPPSGHRFYRLESLEAFDAVRVSHATEAVLQLHTFVALLDAKPAGEVRDTARAATLKAIEGPTALLTSAGGHELKVPAELLVPGRANGNAAVCSPKGALVARLSREGQVNVFDPRSGMGHSWGTHVSSLHAARHVQWLMTGEDDGSGWVNGIAAWTLLSRWQPPRMREMVYSTALEATAVLNHDGTCTVYRPQSGMGLPVIDFDDVADVAAAVALTESPEMPPYTPQRQRAQMRTGALGVPTPLAPRAFTRAQAELVRWLKEDVLPVFQKLAPAPLKLAAGDRVWVGWRNAHTSWGYQGTLQITMLDKQSVLTRPAERGSPHLSMAEIEVARDFLPEQPEPRVGQTIWLEPEAGR